jgi:hypothetical protein
VSQATRRRRTREERLGSAPVAAEQEVLVAVDVRRGRGATLAIEDSRMIDDSSGGD